MVTTGFVTPLADAYKNDRNAAGKEMDAHSAQRDAWQKPLGPAYRLFDAPRPSG
ncbi:hypothetical protein [Streptomyces sp. NPDC004579]|uniref:hypothetical protein n=1 Tax=Streptomyces sp. NPDC004579 TaxID=3154667 RepID=UPI0033B85D14